MWDFSWIFILRIILSQQRMDRVFFACHWIYWASFCTNIYCLLGYYFLKRFSNKGVFRSVSDSMIFIIFSGIFSTAIIPMVLIPVLSLDPDFHWKLIFPKGLQIWISNISGVLIFAPLLMVWGRNTSWNLNLNSILKGLLLLVGAAIITSISAEVRFGLIYLYIPLLIWATFAMGELGSTLAIFIFSITTLILADDEDLTYVISFVDIIAATILILLGALKEKQSTELELKDYSNNLESKILLFTKEQHRREEKLTRPQWRTL